MIFFSFLFGLFSRSHQIVKYSNFSFSFGDLLSTPFVDLQFLWLFLVPCEAQWFDLIIHLIVKYTRCFVVVALFLNFVPGFRLNSISIPFIVIPKSWLRLFTLFYTGIRNRDHWLPHLFYFKFWDLFDFIYLFWVWVVAKAFVPYVFVHLDVFVFVVLVFRIRFLVTLFSFFTQEVLFIPKRISQYFKFTF